MPLQKRYGKRIHLIHERPKHIICPPFYNLDWARGCPYECAWCYLQGTFRYLEGGKKPYYYPWEEVKRSLDLFHRKSRIRILNAGELCDSLMNTEYMERILRYVKGIKGFGEGLRILLLTKGDDVDFLLKNHFNDVVIYSASLNAPSVAKHWEIGAPPVHRRLYALTQVFDAGYEIRVRIDPIIYGFEGGYRMLVYDLLADMEPSRITLGTLRASQSLLREAKRNDWKKMLGEWEYYENGRKWKKRPPLNTRLACYRNVIDALKELGYGNIALCKESLYVWQRLGLIVSRCNCLP